MRCSALALVCLCAVGAAVAVRPPVDGAPSVTAGKPVPGFRPPAVPLLLNSPYVNIWSTADNLFDVQPSLWNGDFLEMFSAARVDGKSYILMGNAADYPKYTKPVQHSVVVYATQTVYTFLCGPITITMVFTSPLLPHDWELLSRPSHYVTFTAVATDHKTHSVELYFDSSSSLVSDDTEALITWDRVAVQGVGITEPVTSLRVGSNTQTPLVNTGPNSDHMTWGFLYLTAADASKGAADGASLVLEYSNVTRAQFASSGTVPAADAKDKPAPLYPAPSTLPPVPPQVGVDRGGGDLPNFPVTIATYDDCWALCNKTAPCQAWAFGIPKCGGDGVNGTCWLKGTLEPPADNACRVSGTVVPQIVPAGPMLTAALVFNLGKVGAVPVTRKLVFSVDEFLQIEWFGEMCPPYWRRALPLNDTVTVPMAMLADSYSSYAATINACNLFDAETGSTLDGAGGANYATIAQLTYRQVFGAMGLFFVPSKNTPWYMLKEISSCGCLDTSDVVYPAFPQVLYYSPELMKLMVIPHLEYAMNYTNQPYPLPWAPHHLGYWPVADLPYTEQENMPLEETAWDLLIIAAIAQRQGGDIAWLEPYWPVVQTWYEFLITLLPFPGLQLSTDDFDGQLFNATNLAFKGIAAIAAYGYLVQEYTGNATAAEEAYATAASYANTMVEYAWYDNETEPAQSHFMIGYKGSKGDGGVTSSWAMLYNALWLRLLGYDNLLPNQAAYLTKMEAWYTANQLQQYGLPLNSRALYTKDDWMTFLAATYYTDTVPAQPSAFSNALFTGLFNWANATAVREPLSDWTYTNNLKPAGFRARPVYGAMYAPVLVWQTAAVAGPPADPAHTLARQTFQRVHDAHAAAKRGPAVVEVQ